MTLAEPTLDILRAEAKVCTACDLYRNATQTVFGEGPADAALMLVGEIPGNDEDLAGRPFVGPAGKILSRALDEAGIDRKAAYVTNSVKHFKFEPRGKRRVGAKPNTGEIRACNQWLQKEIALVKPKLIVALGATAAAALLGKGATISKLRGQRQTLGDAMLAVTVHPSYLLRIPKEDARRAEYARFVADLRQAKGWLDAPPERPATSI